MLANATDRDALSVPQTDADALSDVDRAGLHIRMPAAVCPAPGRTVNLLDVEDWIVGSFFVNYLRIWQNPPCVSELMKVSGRSHQRVTAALDRLVAKGWLGKVKMRHQYAPGRFGHRWRIWLPNASPLVALRDGRKGDGYRWVAVPARVARYQSALAVATYMICHEQKRLDGAVTTTPSDLGALLGCDRTTAWRILRFIGARPVIEGRAGRTIYDLPLVYDRKVSRVLNLPGGAALDVHGDVDRALARWNLLTATLDAAGVDVQCAVASVLMELGTVDAPMRLDLVVRVIEERHRRVLTKSPKYRARLALRFGWRMRAGMRRLAKVDQRAFVEGVEGHAELQAAFRDGLSHTCSTCEGTRLVIVTDEHGRDAGQGCPVCTT